MAVTGVVRLVGTGAFAFCFGIAGLARAQPAEAPPSAGFPPSATAPPPAPQPDAAPGPAYTQYGAPDPYVPPPPQPPPYPYYAPPPPAPLPPAEAPAPAPANWGLGAGFGLGDSAIPFSSLSQYVGTNATFPSYRLSLERRLGSSTWLTFNAAFSYSRTQQPVSDVQSGDDPTRPTLELTTFRIAGLLGIRQVVVQRIVDVSLFGNFGIGRAATGGDEPQETESVSTQPGSSVNGLLFVGGLAVERRLIEGLAVRLSAGIISASTSRAEVVRRDNGERKTTVISSQTIDLSLSPALELFFYF